MGQPWQTGSPRRGTVRSFTWRAGSGGRWCIGRSRKLSPELRETVILRDLQEMEYREIAQVLNVPEGTVKSQAESRTGGTGAAAATYI